MLLDNRTPIGLRCPYEKSSPISRGQTMIELSHHIKGFAHYQWLLDHSALANETKEKPGACGKYIFS